MNDMNPNQVPLTDWDWERTTLEDPAPLMAQLRWLAEIGFSNVDVIWKYYNFAVYGGAKP